MWLDQGVVRAHGPVSDVLTMYRAQIERRAALASVDGVVKVARASVTGPGGGIGRTGECLSLALDLQRAETGLAKMFVGVSGFPMSWPVVVLIMLLGIQRIVSAGA